MVNKIVIKGARANNLKNIDVELPRVCQEAENPLLPLTRSMQTVSAGT